MNSQFYNINCENPSQKVDFPTPYVTILLSVSEQVSKFSEQVSKRCISAILLRVWKGGTTLKITKIDIMQVDCKSTDNPIWKPVVCRVYTDAGIYGDGEAALAYGFASSAAFGMVKDFAGLIIGMNPLDTEKIWDHLYKATFWGQNGGPVVFAGISALDIALWDIKGKYMKMPLYQLLGGKKRDKLRTYASQLQFGWGPARTPQYTLKDYQDTAKKAIDEGYDAVKVDFFTFDPDPSKAYRYNYEDQTRLQKPEIIGMIESRLAAVREAVGPNVDIIMENHSYTDAQAAIQIGRMAQPYNIFYFEEPTTPTPKITKYVHDQLQMPIASGERIYARWGFAPYFEDGSLDVIQPDMGTCGGLTEGKKICDMAYTYDVNVQMHVCASPLSTALALHLEATLPNFVIHEHHVYNLHEYNQKLCIHNYQPKDGFFEIPELPGIGNELSDYCFENTLMKVTIE